MICNTMRCKRPAMEGHRCCAFCTLEIERQAGLGGFSMHGREPSELYVRALAEIERIQRERLNGQK